MGTAITEFRPKYSRLVCIDSDGCAIDSMEIKHRACFGPCLVAQWGLEAIGDKLLTRWNELNLYSPTRGINRFKGLALILEEFDIPGWQEIKDWIRRTGALSNDALKQETSIALKKALEWSFMVNEAIEALPLPEPFAGVKEAIEMLDGQADIATVSSANPGAIEKEWASGSLLKHVSILLSQNDGSKGSCIAGLLQRGYDRSQVLMIGDAPGDWQAAQENKVDFYPIIPSREGESWRLFKERAWREFCSGSLSNEYIDAFRRQLQL